MFWPINECFNNAVENVKEKVVCFAVSLSFKKFYSFQFEIIKEKAGKMCINSIFRIKDIEKSPKTEKGSHQWHVVVLVLESYGRVIYNSCI